MTITTHLDELPENDARDFRTIVRMLRALPEAEPSPGLNGRILARLRGGPRLTKVWWWAAAAASLAVMLVLHSNRPSSGKDIRWLAENQEADGTWAPARHGGTEAFRPALTALSVLALKQEPHLEKQIAKGVAALAALQTADGAFGGDDGQARLYNLAMATCALAMCGADGPALSRAVTQIAACQEPDGSWTYTGTHEGNAAITAWMTRALACAEANGDAGASVPLRKGLRWLRGNVRDDGRMAYHPASAPSDTLTALSAYSLIEAGKLFPDLQALGVRMTDTIGIQSSGGPDCYRDYAKIIAFESAGKTAPAESVRTQLRQRRGANAQDQWHIAGGRLYTAALTTLCRVQ